MNMQLNRLSWLSLALLLAWPASAAERALELRLDDSQAIEIHNLAGEVRVVPGGAELVIRATVTAETQQLADEVRLTPTDRRNKTRVVVEYPAKLSELRYDGEEFRRLRANIDYQGRRIRLSDSKGQAVRVDLEIAVPAGHEVSVHQAIGAMSADNVAADLILATRYGRVRVTDGSGRLRADTGSGAIEIGGFRGDVIADTGSGKVRVENVLGAVHADTGSGGVALRGIDGDIRADTGSGSVSIIDARADRIVVDTGSGGVRLRDVSGSLNVDTGSGAVRGEGIVAGSELIVDTGSGGVALAGDLGALRRVVVDTGSGGVTLESSTPLNLRLDLRSGSAIRVDIPTLGEVESSRRSFRAVAGAGEGNARISTGSGGIRISAP